MSSLAMAKRCVALACLLLLSGCAIGSDYSEEVVALSGEARGVSAQCWREARASKHSKPRNVDPDDEEYASDRRRASHDACMRRHGFVKAARD